MSILISIITPCYNAEKYLADTIESVIHQSYCDWEMIIVDDCSTDNSRDIIEAFMASDKRIKLFKTPSPSGSPSLPRNIGLEHANGEYIAFLDADDLWLPDKLNNQIEYIKTHNSVFIYSNYEKMDHAGHRNNRIIKMPDQSSFWDILESCSIPCLTVMVSKKIIDGTRFKQIPKEDYAFWLDLLKKDVVAYNTGHVDALYREQQHSRSSNKWKMISQQWFILRHVQGIKPLVASYFMITFLIKGFFKYIK